MWIQCIGWCLICGKEQGQRNFRSASTAPCKRERWHIAKKPCLLCLGWKLRSRLIQYAAHIARQSVQRKRLLQNGGRRIHIFILTVQGGVYRATRHEKDLHPWADRRQTLRQFAASDIRHHEIRYQKVNRLWIGAGHLQSLIAVGCD